MRDLEILSLSVNITKKVKKLLFLVSIYSVNMHVLYTDSVVI